MLCQLLTESFSSIISLISYISWTSRSLISCSISWFMTECTWLCLVGTCDCLNVKKSRVEFLKANVLNFGALLSLSSGVIIFYVVKFRMFVFASPILRSESDFSGRSIRWFANLLYWFSCSITTCGVFRGEAFCFSCSFFSVWSWTNVGSPLLAHLRGNLPFIR